jgi:hypothetical protein
MNRAATALCFGHGQEYDLGTTFSALSPGHVGICPEAFSLSLGWLSRAITELLEKSNKDLKQID